MTGRRSIALALLCAVAFSAFAAQSASAEGTTQFTCVKEGSPAVGTHKFADAHCKTIDDDNGEYWHVEIGTSTTEITVTNASTSANTTTAVPAELETTLGGVAVKITCNTVHGTGWTQNKEAAGSMFVEGTVTVNYTGCTVNEPLNCTVAAPIVLTSKGETKEMRVDATIDAPKTNFVEITLGGGAPCALNGSTIIVKGVANATPSGATLTFNTSGKEELTVGLKEAKFRSTVTVVMKEAGEKTGNPISLTTEGTEEEPPPREGTTQFTCVKEGSPAVGTHKFADAHCKTIDDDNGEYWHVEIGTSTTEITVTNASTSANTTTAVPAELETTLGGVAVKITCNTVHGTGWTQNKEAAGSMFVEGTVTVNYTGCTVNEPLNCTVAAPIVLTSKGETKEMRVDATIDAPKTNFVEITLGGGAPCALNGSTIIVKGVANATPSGATLTFNTSGKEELTVGLKEAKFRSTVTVVMKEAGEKTGNPISLTTEGTEEEPPPREGTTQFTCVKEGSPAVGTHKFADAHCKTIDDDNGEYWHVEIGTSTTEITVTNASTSANTTTAVPAELETTLGGVAVKITCNTVHGTGWTQNKEAAGSMFVEGTVTVNYTGCTVNEPLNCTVAAPIVLTSKGETKEMRVDATIDAPKTNFVEITLGGGAPCALNGSTIIVKGVANATPSGATLTFNTSGKEELTVGLKEAKFRSTVTVVMKEAGEKTGNPISLTTEGTEEEPPPREGTTQFTCVKEGSPAVGTHKFADAHCKTIDDDNGEYWHVEIGTSTTEITVTNASTSANTTTAVPAELETTLGGVAVKITCNTVHGTGWTQNKEAAGSMFVEGTVTVNYTGCTVNEPLNCTVAAPIVLTSKGETKEMRVDATIDAPKTNFVEITLGGGAPCALNGSTIIVKGVANATPSGATLTFNTSGKEELTVGLKEAKFRSTVTVVMKEAGEKTGNPISLTTEGTE